MNFFTTQNNIFILLSLIKQFKHPKMHNNNNNYNKYHVLKNNIYAFLANFTIPYLVILIMNNPSQAILIWPAVGIGVISALVWGYGVMPALYLSHYLLSNLIHPTNHFIIHDFIIQNISLIIELLNCYLGAYFIRYFIGYPNPIVSNKTILRLYLVIGPLVAFISSTLNSLINWLLLSDYNNNLYSYTNSWLMIYLGFIIFAPLFLVVIGRPKPVWQQRYLSLQLPVIILFCSVIFLYNKTEQTDQEILKQNFTIKSELITKILNQKLEWQEDLIKVGLNHFLPLKNWKPQFEQFLSNVNDYDGTVVGIAWVDKSQNTKFFKPKKTDNSLFNSIKKVDISQYTLNSASKYHTKYHEKLHLFSNTIQLNKKNEKTHLIIFHDSIKLLTSTINHYRLYNTKVKLKINHLNKEFELGDEGNPIIKDFSIQTALNFNSERWELNYQLSEKYLSSRQFNKNTFMARIGLIFTGLLSMLLLIITGKKMMTDILVKEKTLGLDIEINQFKNDKKQYQKLIENHPVVLWRQNIKSNQITYISSKVEEIYGYEKSLWLNNDDFRNKHILKEDRNMVANTISKAIANRTSFELEYRFIRSDSSVAWVKDVVSFNKDKDGDAQLVGLMIDTTETNEAKNKQSISESKYRTLFKFAPEPLIIIDLENHLFKDFNDKANQLFGLNKIAGSLTLSDLSPIKQPDNSISKDRLLKIYKILFTKNIYKIEWRMYNKSHKEITCKIEFLKLPETKYNLILASITDITEKREHDRKINQLAYYDKLTSLPNREYFYSKFEFFHQLACDKKTFGTIIYLDLDRFKLLNDSLGHQAGDKLLAMVALRIKNTSRNNDFCARLGGDEFIILTRNLEKDIEGALELSLIKSELILEALSEPYQLGNYEHYITPSIGISVYPHKDFSLDEIIHQADIAMYASKDKGKNTITVFQDSMIQQVAKKLHLENAVEAAIDNKELELHYQIKVDQNEKSTSAEALLRWSRLKEFNINTEKFIQIIDTVGMTNELGNWVIEQACSQLQKWKKECTIQSLAINISPKQLHQKLFVEQIISVVTEYKIAPQQITLELTETVLFENRKALIQKLKDLRTYGIKISLDDFGTGYSSLAYLQNLPIDQLKIDKMFIDNLSEEKSTQHVIKTIITLAKLMKIELIVEGIETKEQFKILKSLGVQYFQGYYFAKPLPNNQITKLR